MARSFSDTQRTGASGFFESGENIEFRCVQRRPAEGDVGVMPALPETPEELAARTEQQRADQRTMLEHLPAWFRRHNLRQRDVAQALGVSDATVSNWIAGKQQMSVGQLRQIAVLLRAEPGDLLRPPGEAGVSAQVEEALSLMDALSPTEWEAVMQTARTIAQAKQKN